MFKQTLNFLLIFFVTACLSPVCTALADGKNSDLKKHVPELTEALVGNLTLTYICQANIGGAGFYNAAKSHAENIMTALSGDRNKAVISIDKLEQKLKADCPDPAKCINQSIQKNNEVQKEDVDKACVDQILAQQNKLHLVEAKMGLLK